MERRGGIRFRDRLDKLQEDILNYFGTINEVKAGVRNTPSERPEALSTYMLMEATGLPLSTGGLLDQPHLWLMEWEVVDNTVKMFREINTNSEKTIKKQV